MPTPVTPATVTDEPGPEIAMALAHQEICVVLQRAAVHHRERAAEDDDALAKPSTVSAPPLIVSPPPKQSHSVRSPPIVPILPPLLAPVRVSVVEVLASSSEPAPENEPEKVVLVPPAIVR